jgi:hypothetical protein
MGGLARSMMAQDQVDELHQHIRRGPPAGSGLRERLRQAYPDSFPRADGDDLKDDDTDGPPPVNSHPLSSNLLACACRCFPGAKQRVGRLAEMCTGFVFG